MGLHFEDPPELRKAMPRGHHISVAAQLKERPGDWARIGLYGSTTSAGQMAQQIRRGQLVAYQPSGAFEAVARTVNGEHRVYARFIGEGSNDS